MRSFQVALFIILLRCSIAKMWLSDARRQVRSYGNVRTLTVGMFCNKWKTERVTSTKCRDNFVRLFESIILKKSSNLFVKPLCRYSLSFIKFCSYRKLLTVMIFIVQDILTKRSGTLNLYSCDHSKYNCLRKLGENPPFLFIFALGIQSVITYFANFAQTKLCRYHCSQNDSQAS